MSDTPRILSRSRSLQNPCHVPSPPAAPGSAPRAGALAACSSTCSTITCWLADWERHCSEPLAAYAARLYAALEAHAAALPPKARKPRDACAMATGLSLYRDAASVGQAIDRMAIYRIRRANPLAGGIEEFLADVDGFTADFAAFLPDALAFARTWRGDRPM